VNSLADLFEKAATVVSGSARLSDSDDHVRRLIETLGYHHADPTLSPQRAALLRAAARLKRVFRLQAPDAPGLVFFGGEADPTTTGWTGSGHTVAGLSGTGLSADHAFESCVGEGIEYLSQYAVGQDDVERARLDERIGALDGRAAQFIDALAQHADIPPDRELAWIGAKRLCDDTKVHLPADMCLRRSREDRDFVPPFKLSTGCGAGHSFNDAALHGLFELIERDAVSLWWRGGRRGRTIAPDSAAGRVAGGLLARLRDGQTGRTSWLLDITTDVGVPCAAALSCAPNGRGLACGHAARATMTAAVHAAVLEMCQMELAYVVVEAKRREAGEDALNDGDLLHIRRATLIDADTCALLHPEGPALVVTDRAAPRPAHTLQTLIEGLNRMNIETYAVDLTREVFGIPVVRIVAPGLQLAPSAIATERLTKMIAETGGGLRYAGGVDLL
jgi:ribosomal protein S12 methylthiotransferase accessory factor